MRLPIEPARVLACALNRFVSGETYERIGDRFGLGHATTIECTRRVTQAILDTMWGLISFPDTEGMTRNIAKFARQGFANCIGAIDCTHFFLEKRDKQLDTDYHDRTHNYSVVAQCVSDMDLRILDFAVGWPGAVHDSRVLRRSSLYSRPTQEGFFADTAARLDHGGRVNQYLIGDAGYPNLPWLLRPIPDQPQGDRKRFNDAHESVRKCVERCFGRLKGMWRVLYKRQKGDVNGINAQIQAIGVLYNFCIDGNVYFNVERFMARHRNLGLFNQHDDEGGDAGINEQSGDAARDEVVAHMAFRAFRAPRRG
ncbi:hypothetical protein CBR_g12312 [Chara braunii]|uniref:DDE Tnp4 domain-containing protein n=1 Tax=Chara braunii TaxID=69332 RepID=A0A388KRQ0_CHABU|nr:hypothetical protein CBR_g12312 [Chara braunii]|eukprot:GBG72745.1 hypothetical protein CBR_g12312 [Chara braunii]